MMEPQHVSTHAFPASGDAVVVAATQTRQAALQAEDRGNGVDRLHVMIGPGYWLQDDINEDTLVTEC